MTYLDSVDYEYHFQPIEYYENFLDNDGIPLCKHYDHVGQQPCGWEYHTRVGLNNSTYVYVGDGYDDDDEICVVRIGPIPPIHHGPRCPWDIDHPTYRPLPA